MSFWFFLFKLVLLKVLSIVFEDFLGSVEEEFIVIEYLFISVEEEELEMFVFNVLVLFWIVIIIDDSWGNFIISEIDFKVGGFFGIFVFNLEDELVFV